MLVILEQFQLDGFPALEAAVEASAVDAAKITELEALEMLDDIDFDGVDAAKYTEAEMEALEDLAMDAINESI